MLEWWRPMVALAIDSALRMGELGALQVKDLDLLKHSVRVRGTAVEVSKKFTNAATMRQVTDTKTAAAGWSPPSRHRPSTSWRR